MIFAETLNWYFFPKTDHIQKNWEIKKVSGTLVPVTLMAVVTVSVSFGLHQSNGGLSIYIGSTKKSNSEKPNVKFFTVAPSLEVIFKVALSKGASIETFCTSWPPGGAVWQLHTWNPLVLWVTGIWFKGGRFWAAQSRKINFFRQKLKPFESPDTLTWESASVSELVQVWCSAFLAHLPSKVLISK